MAAHLVTYSVSGGGFLDFLADAARHGFGWQARSAFRVINILDTDFDHAAFARRTNLFGDQLLAIGTTLLLLHLLDLMACVEAG